MRYENDEFVYEALQNSLIYMYAYFSNETKIFLTSAHGPFQKKNGHSYYKHTQRWKYDSGLFFIVKYVLAREFISW